MTSRSTLSVVVTTYQWPQALDSVLWALSEQSDRRFEVVVADDGSGPETAETVERWQSTFGARLRHVWQPDEGYRLASARNRGALAAVGDQLVFLDGDCVPRRHFARALRASVRPGWFVAGRRLFLPESLTRRVLDREAAVHRWSSFRWVSLRPGRVDGLSSLTPRDRRRAGRAGMPEFHPHDRAYGFLLGLLRSDFECVDGYDTRYVGWGEEDVELAVRLRRLGLRCGHAGPHATLLHLWHPSREVRERPNWWLLQQTEQGSHVEAVQGLRWLAEEGKRAPSKR